MGILAEPLQFVRDLKLPAGYTVCELGDQYITEEIPHRLARNFYEETGCSRYISIDGNGRATRTFDLNLPLPAILGRFDLVTDFGTGEHIFDQRQLFKSIHQLVQNGGHFVWDRPCQGYRTHCFWLADECVYRNFAAANLYKVERLERRTTSRGELIRGVMRKIGDKKFRVPQQSRYRKLLRPITGEA
jgi:SAM-dependent methyltransferase